MCISAQYTGEVVSVVESTRGSMPVKTNNAEIMAGNYDSEVELEIATNSRV